MNINFGQICNDLLVIPIYDGALDISWGLDTDKLVQIFIENGINKIYDFHEKINFIIQIDNVNTFDSVNLREYKFNELQQNYIGNIIFSGIFPFHKNQPQPTHYYLRIKVDETETTFLTNESNYEFITIQNDWSDTLSFTIPTNYTKNIVEYMYSLVADFNAYNKDVKSANFYYLFQAFAYSLNTEYTYVVNTKNSNFINKSLPDSLYDVFGLLFKFTNIDNLSMEEYRRILKNLILGYQHGGSWSYIKNTLKYLIGYTPELLNFYRFYPWILRKQSIQDPEKFSDKNYYNPETNFYLFKSDYSFTKNQNQVMLIGSNFKKFTFIVKTDNFFNRPIDESKVRDILDILKPAYTRYILNLNLENIIDLRGIKADDNHLIWTKEDEEYLMY